MDATTRPVALFAALDEEARSVAGHLETVSISPPHLSLWVGTIEATPVVLAVTGVGKVAAALSTQFVCDAYHPRCAIAFGLAGATDGDTRAGQLIVATGALQHDMDARPLTKARGVIPSLGKAVFAADQALSASLRRAAEQVVRDPRTVSSGLVLTGDQIVSSREFRDGRWREFPEGLCFDMETAAIAQVAHQNDLPWAALRMTSDAADETFDLDQVISFGTNTAADLFGQIVQAFLRAVEHA
ncbi:MAG TPA: 5'-methylthioadenosine/S-adenosylhomocysteine nucleosidase [Candidatus Dormibacteraeota bacterium]